MAKQRISIPSALSAEILFISDRICCVCRIPGRKIQLHHIDDDPSNNTLGNLAVLCLECHGDTQISGGFGRKLDADQVLKYRDDWHNRVRSRREEADRIAATAQSSSTSKIDSPATELIWPVIPTQTGLLEYIAILPELRRLAYQGAQPGWDSSTAEQMEATYRTLDVLEAALVVLASYYPHGHFDSENPRDYFSELISTRFRWHRYHYSTNGNGFSGTIIGPLAGGAVISDVEEMVADMVSSLTLEACVDGEFDYEAWLSKWRQRLA